MSASCPFLVASLGGAEPSVPPVFLLAPQVGPKLTELPQRISSAKWCLTSSGRCACAPRSAPRLRVAQYNRHAVRSHLRPEGLHVSQSRLFQSGGNQIPPRFGVTPSNTFWLTRNRKP